jgi:hypothetical protein
MRARIESISTTWNVSSRQLFCRVSGIRNHQHKEFSDPDMATSLPHWYVTVEQTDIPFDPSITPFGTDGQQVMSGFDVGSLTFCGIFQLEQVTFLAKARIH